MSIELGTLEFGTLTQRWEPQYSESVSYYCNNHHQISKKNNIENNTLYTDYNNLILENNELKKFIQKLYCDNLELNKQTKKLNEKNILLCKNHVELINILNINK